MTAVGWILLGIVLASAMVTFGRWAYDEGDRDGQERGYAKGKQDGKQEGRQEVDRWWIEMDQQLDEEWMKIWREER